ncbi:MAG TPA: glycoside hydrolase family 16 protein [Stellaceae bacterium]|nr:glycoside hydrolase family 16 protein [Stellaceae bacterium]
MLGGAASLLVCAGRAEAAAPGFAPAGYRLVFGDDFDDRDVSRINEAATGGRAGAPAWRSRYRHDRFTIINEEKQIYVDPAFAGTAGHALGVQPFSIANSILTISANRADPTRVQPFVKGIAYTSGCITSELTFWRTYGYYEMRARLPLGKGFFPAFWLLPKRLAWPPEIDVFEASGMRPDDVHVGVLGPERQGGNTWIKGVIQIAQGFHVYGLDWNPESIAWFLDGREVWRQPNSIREDMYVLANLAVGNRDPNFIPNPDSSTPFPGRFEIDYIRVYARA